jgi:hypothetical protein
LVARPTALWTVGLGRADLRPADLGRLRVGEARVRALVSGISRGSESLVFHGRAPKSEWQRMRCPFQEGDFPYPVKYGQAMVGVVEDGPRDLVGRRVFSPYPHQSLFHLGAQHLVPIPDAIPSERAVLAPQMETALNAAWDAGPRIGDRIAVVGGGTIGILTAYLCAQLPGTEVTVIDINPKRRALTEGLGLTFAAPGEAQAECDLVFHASGTSEGLNTALTLAGFEAEVVELSWFGDKPVHPDLGGGFHSQRLSLRASQAGAVAAARRPRWDQRRRLVKALDLCADPRLDSLALKETPLEGMPIRMGLILSDPDTLCHLIRYS